MFLCCQWQKRKVIRDHSSTFWRSICSNIQVIFCWECSERSGAQGFKAKVTAALFELLFFSMINPSHWHCHMPVFILQRNIDIFWVIYFHRQPFEQIIIHLEPQKLKKIKNKKKSNKQRQKPNVQLKRPARCGFQKHVFKSAVYATSRILILPFLPCCKNRIPRCSVKQWPWHFDILKSNFQPSVERAAIWLNYSPPKTWSSQTCKITNEGFCFFPQWNKAS